MKRTTNPHPATPSQLKVLGTIYLGGPLTTTQLQRTVPNASRHHAIEKLSQAGWIKECGRVRRVVGDRRGRPSIRWEISKKGIAQIVGF